MLLIGVGHSEAVEARLNSIDAHDTNDFGAGQVKLNSIDLHDTNKCWGDK